MSFVTLACEGCGVDLEQPATGRPRRTCSSACKQRAYRRRRAEFRNDPVRGPLTFEQRDWLRAEVDRRTRKRLQAQAVRQREADARLGDEWEIAA